MSPFLSISDISRIAGMALDVVFPMECFGCGDEGAAICKGCQKDLPRLTPPYCRSCGQPGIDSPCISCREMPLAVDGIRAPFLLEGPVRRAVHGLKYRNLRAAAPQLGEMLGEHLVNRRVPGDLLVPVPIHPRRLRQRGYNQSELLAKSASKAAGIPWDKGLLKRARNSPPQVEAQGRSERRENVKDSFESSDKVPGCRLILIDDVATTGSTLSACADALRAAGAESVWALTLAREA